MNYLNANVFPSHVTFFPIVSQSKLISGAFQETKAITQAPDGMIYLSAISSVSVALQGLIDVELPIGKICPVSLSTLTIADSGERKSTVENLLTKGVKSFVEDATKKHKEKLKTYSLRLEFHEKEAAKIRRGE